MNKSRNEIKSRNGKETISAAEFDRRFEAGLDISRFMDLKNARRPGRPVQRVNVDFPKPFLEQIDQASRRIGVTRQAWIKTAVAEYLARHSTLGRKQKSAA